MKKFINFLTYSSALLGVTLFLRPADDSFKILLWIPKLVAAAFSPIIWITSALGVMLGVLRSDWKLAGAGILGAGLSSKFIKDLPNSDYQFKKNFWN